VRVRLLLAAAVAASACGPSSSEIKQAKDAVYTCELDQIVQAAVEVVKEETPPLGGVDHEIGTVTSAFRWHSASGMRKKAGVADVGQGDVGFQLEVAAASAERGFRLRVIPRVFSQSPDSPRGREMTHEDANWPGWADAKADTVQFKIHEKLSSCTARGG
jgi:hypothetical protein